MSSHPAISVDQVSKTFWIQMRSDATILSRMADFFPSGAKRHLPRCIRAVDDVSFTVARGEVLGVIGRNASGKTTLLQLLAGIYYPDSGAIHTDGKIISLINLSVGLNLRLSVLDNIFLTCSMYGMPRAEIEEIHPSILEFAGVEQYIDMYPYQLSQGMSQRLAFSIAVHTKPDILLLDEVFSAGDMQFQKKASAKMEELIGGDVTVVMVSHNIDRILALSDKVLWMDKGTVQGYGDPGSVTNAYIEKLYPAKKPIRV